MFKKLVTFCVRLDSVHYITFKRRNVSRVRYANPKLHNDFLCSLLQEFSQRQIRPESERCLIRYRLR